MAKRFIDTKLWDKSWYRKLSPNDKLLWIYILTKCDHAGIMDGDWEAAGFFIGCKISFSDFPDPIKNKMVHINDDQYFIPSFIDYQYGVLRENSKPHLSVIKRLKEKGLTNYLNGVLSTVKDKEKEKDIEKRKEIFKEKAIKVINEKKYDENEVKGFVNFWTEKNSNETKLRYEYEKTFEIGRRLATWVRNNRDWSKNGDKNVRKKMQFTTS